MFLTIAGVLDPEELQDIRKLMARASWASGAKTAGAAAREVKRNLQADLSAGSGRALKEIVMPALQANPVLTAFARPAAWSDLLLSRTEVDGGYGTHIDNPFMTKEGGRVRTDLSFTLFLSDPQTYEGGELVVELAGVTHQVKAEAGDLLVYPSTTLHHVATVTSGTRYACVGWIQSMIRRADQREIMFDLSNLKVELGQSHGRNSPEIISISKTIANLTRMWAE